MLRSPLALAGALLAVSACGARPAATEPSASTTATTPRTPPPMARAVPTAGPVASVAEPAERGVPYDPAATCDISTVEALAARHPGVDQFVVMATDSFADTWGTVDVAVFADGAWRCQIEGRQARFGRSGTRPLAERRSGDGTTPAGVFPLATVTAWDGEAFSMFGNFADPGVLAPYRAVRSEDCWGATPNAPTYQHLFELSDCPGPDDEDLERIGGVYGHAAVIGANLDPISGDAPGETPYAAAIFLHRHNYGNGATSGTVRPTSGCVSLALGDLVDTLRTIDPALEPHFAIGPTDWLRSTA